jgi:predicted TIM-barrel fold metal-dependent hydrolase
MTDESTGPRGPDPRELPLSDYRPVRAIRTTVTDVRRASVPAVDIHNHLGRWLSDDDDWLCPDVAVLLDVMERCNVVHIVNLDGRWGAELRDNLERYDEVHPDRFSTFCHVDWSALAEQDGAVATEQMLRQLRESSDAGAKGLKVWKDLGLGVRDSRDALVLPDDPRVAPVFELAGELGLPVLIHVADPVAFFAPIDVNNERLEDLAANPDWWFGRAGLPSFDRLIDALETVVSSHRGTTFIGAHVGCAAEDLSRVSRMLADYPNLNVDLGGRMAELGRQPRAAARLILDHPNQVLFGTDQYPVEETEYHRWFRFLESSDECFSYAPEDEPPPMGRWDVSALALPDSAFAALYADNARRVLGR